MQQPCQNAHFSPVADAVTGVVDDVPAPGEGIPFAHVRDLVTDEQIAIKHPHIRIGRQHAQHPLLTNRIRIRFQERNRAPVNRRDRPEKSGTDINMLIGRRPEHPDDPLVGQPLLQQSQGEGGLVGQGIEPEPRPHLLLVEELPDFIFDPGVLFKQAAGFKFDSTRRFERWLRMMRTGTAGQQEKDGNTTPNRHALPIPKMAIGPDAEGVCQRRYDGMEHHTIMIEISGTDVNYRSPAASPEIRRPTDPPADVASSACPIVLLPGHPPPHLPVIRSGSPCLATRAVRSSDASRRGSRIALSGVVAEQSSNVSLYPKIGIGISVSC